MTDTIADQILNMTAQERRRVSLYSSISRGSIVHRSRLDIKYARWRRRKNKVARKSRMDNRDD